MKCFSCFIHDFYISKTTISCLNKKITNQFQSRSMFKKNFMMLKKFWIRKLIKEWTIRTRNEKIVFVTKSNEWIEKKNNQKFEWYKYIDIQIFNLLTNYHHKYSKRIKFYRTFVRLNDRISSLWTKRKLLRQKIQRISNNQSKMYTNQNINSCRLVKSKLKRKRTKMIDFVFCLYKLNVHLKNSKTLNWIFHDLQHVLIHKFHSRKNNRKNSRKNLQRLAICLKKK